MVLQSQTAPPPPPPRVGPRPLPLHLALEGWILQSSFAALMRSSGVSAPWSAGWDAGWSASLPPPPDPASDPARLVAAEAAGRSLESLTGPWQAHLDPARFTDALLRESAARMARFVAGVRAYHGHPHRRRCDALPAVWRRGAAALRCAGDGGGAPAGSSPAVLYVPSLVNRAYILDLAPDRSLVRAGAAAGFAAFLLDWGAPGAAERGFTVTDYVEGVLVPAMEAAAARTGGPVRLVGYCMGGLLAAAAAVLRPDLVAALALLATPWDFHAENAAVRAMMAALDAPLAALIDAAGEAPVDLLQAMFAALDPTLAGRKFRDFAGLDPDAEAARRFVELEDWLNDGVPLAAPVMKECLSRWYGANDPARGVWRVAGTVIDPARIACPTLVLIPGQDRIVPPGSARALARAIPGARARDVPFGHIGMVAGGSAPRRVYAPLIDWLRAPA